MSPTHQCGEKLPFKVMHESEAENIAAGKGQEGHNGLSCFDGTFEDTLNVIVHHYVNCNVIGQTIYGRKQKIEYQDRKVGTIGRHAILHISSPECDQNNLYQLIKNLFLNSKYRLIDWLID